MSPNSAAHRKKVASGSRPPNGKLPIRKCGLGPGGRSVLLDVFGMTAHDCHGEGQLILFVCGRFRGERVSRLRPNEIHLAVGWENSGEPDRPHADCGRGRSFAARILSICSTNSISRAGSRSSAASSQSFCQSSTLLSFCGILPSCRLSGCCMRLVSNSRIRACSLLKHSGPAGGQAHSVSSDFLPTFSTDSRTRSKLQRTRACVFWTRFSPLRMRRSAFFRTSAGALLGTLEIPTLMQPHY